MNSLVEAMASSIGKKVVMALSGAGLVIFVILHMTGNLQMFIGQDAMNDYAVFLRELGPLLWIVRIGLIVFFLVHIIDGIRLKLQNRSARPVPYASKNTVQATRSSLTMMISGSIILVFLIYHLLHFTFGVTNPAHFSLIDSEGRHDVYSMVVLGFQNIFISGAYIIAMLLLSPHLAHGASSFLQSLGINHPRLNGFIRKLGPVVSFIVVAGFIAVPVGVLLGIIQLPPSKGGM